MDPNGKFPLCKKGRCYINLNCVEIGTGTTFVNIANETGLVVPPSDPGALRQAMGQLWDNPQQAAEMGQRAQARYWEHFTAEQMVAAYVGLYRELAGR